jgi:thiamine transporter ThiT
MKNKKGQGAFGIIIITLLVAIFLYGLCWYLPHFSFGWDTGLMTGTIIGYDSNMFGTKSVFVLEDRSVFTDNRMSQSQITLCSDFDDVEIHKLVEKYINQKVVIEYQERRIGYYPFKYCHESPITSIKPVEEK